MPDRVSDAPIPETISALHQRLYDEWRADPTSEEFHFWLLGRIALLEAEKQDAHTEGWNAHEDAVDSRIDFFLCREALTDPQKEAVRNIRDRLASLSKPTAAKPEPSPSSAKQGEPS